MFDTTLLESRKSRRFRGRGAGFPLAVAAHALLIGAFVGASAWSVGEPEEPETRIAVFPTFSPPPPPPPLPGGGEQVPTHAPPPRRDDDTQPPAFLPPDLPVSGSEVPSTGPGESGSETEGPGSPFGTPGGTGEVPSVGPPGESDVILRPGGDVTAPVLLSRVDPVYPEAARRARLEGTLILEAVITAAGDVQDVRVLKSVNPLLDASAAQAVRQWRYRPATWNGRAVPVYLTVTVRFSLRD